MNEKELDALLDALFPENVVTPSPTAPVSAKPCDPVAGLGYVARQSECDTRVAAAFKRLDGSEKKHATRGNDGTRKFLSRTDASRQKTGPSAAAKVPKESESCSKITNRQQTQSFMDRILKKVKR